MIQCRKALLAYYSTTDVAFTALRLDTPRTHLQERQEIARNQAKTGALSVRWKKTQTISKSLQTPSPKSVLPVRENKTSDVNTIPPENSPNLGINLHSWWNSPEGSARIIIHHVLPPLLVKSVLTPRRNQRARLQQSGQRPPTRHDPT